MDKTDKESLQSKHVVAQVCSVLCYEPSSSNVLPKIRSQCCCVQFCSLHLALSRQLQCMVSELKTGFSSALLELSQIQHGDTYLREELEENRRSCQKKALRLEALVETLRVRLLDKKSLKESDI